MTTATAEQDVEVPTEDDAPAQSTTAEELASFSEGFGTDKSNPPTGEPPPAPEEKVAEPTPPADPTPPPVAKRKLADLDEDAQDRLITTMEAVGDIRSTMEKQFGTAFGKMGGLERSLKEIIEKTPSGQAVEVSEEDLAELKADFPELTQKMVTGINRALSKVKGTGTAIDPKQLEDAVEQRVATRVQAYRDETNCHIADITMPGWRDTVLSPDFKTWFAGKGYEEPTNPAALKKVLDEYTVHQNTNHKPTPPKTPTPPRSRSRIENALPAPRAGGMPTGGTGTEEQEFLKGFKGG